MRQFEKEVMIRTISIILVTAILCCASQNSSAKIAASSRHANVGIAFGNKPGPQPLKISPNGRYFMTPDGKPFFWLGDTGWLLFSKLTREETIRYLDDRKAKGFNVIQVMVVHQVA